MSPSGEPEKALERSLEVHLPRLERTPTESTLDEALDAEANYSQLQAAGANEQKFLDPGPPPNGGYYAWLQVAGSFFLFFNCWYVGELLSRRCFVLASWLGPLRQQLLPNPILPQRNADTTS
jgi:hypothetical protein